MSFHFESETECVLYNLRQYLTDLEGLNKLEPSRYLSLCITHLEESIFFLDRAHSLSMKENYKAYKENYNA